MFFSVSLPFNDPPRPDLEAQRRAAVVAGVKLGAVGGEGAAVVHVDVVALFRLARARLHGRGHFYLEARAGDEGHEGREGDEGGGEEEGAHLRGRFGGWFCGRQEREGWGWGACKRRLC